MLCDVVVPRGHRPPHRRYRHRRHACRILRRPPPHGLCRYRTAVLCVSELRHRDDLRGAGAPGVGQGAQYASDRRLLAVQRAAATRGDLPAVRLHLPSL